MHDWLERAARVRPGVIALEHQSGETLTYANLHRRAELRAAELASDGVSTGAAAPLPERHRLEFATDLHACVLQGAVAVPIDQRLSPEEQSRRVAHQEVPIPDVATVMYTSGTTSVPKPVYLTHGNWEANAVGSAIALGLDPNERWLCVMPLAHVGGLSILLRSTFYATTVVVHEQFETDAVLHELMDPSRRITLVSLVPTMLSRLLDAGLSDPPALRWVLLGGGPLPAALLARAAQAGVPVAPTYGMTEACSQIATFGFPLVRVELRTADGEVLVRGPIVSPAALDSDGWLHTGDLGDLGADGRLRIVGRKSDTIISGGENVAPVEVEAVLALHPGVADAGVYAQPDPEWGESVHAAVVLRAGASVSADELRDFCAQRLARFKVPKQVAFVTALPRTTSGKLLRRDLPGGGR